MIPLIPTLALAFVSFVSSAFVILRILIPILPPHPLSRRVAPSEFGLPDYRSISPADKSHIWLATCDLLALAIFTWQAVSEYLGGPVDYTIAHDPASAVRLWFALTLRQSCLFVVSALTLLHVRMGRPVSFGGKHWMLWAPTLVLVVTSTALAGVFAATNVTGLFVGLVAYSSTIAVFSSIAFGCLVGTLVIIKRNLAALNDIRDPWPPAKVMEEEKPRPSFATEDIDALKDGSSWITSRASSRCDSISAFSFSTHHTHHSRAASNASARMLPNPVTASYPSLAPKSSFWFNPATPFGSRESVPPVPPLPAPYRPASTTSAHINDDPDPFKRQAPRMGSQSSWLTEPSTYQPTLSNWSFPSTHPPSPPPSAATLPGLGTDMLPSTAVSRPMTPAMASAEVLGGYGYVPENSQAEKGFNSFSSTSSGDLDMTIYRTIGWMLMIWVPLGLALPYLFMVSPGSVTSPFASILLLLSVTLSSPLLAVNILFRSPIPIPSGLFETYNDPPSAVLRAPSPQSTAPSYKFSHEYKRSGSVTVVEGRRSTDVWLTNGDAVDGKGKIGRALGLLQPKPKLAVLPPDGEKMQEEPLTPPLPMQMATERSLPPTPAQSELSAELGHTRHRKESKASSYYSGTSDGAAFQTQIMIAQRHYSALATTMVVPPSPTGERRASMDDSAIGVAVSGVETPQTQKASRHSQHLRVRSVSSITSVSVGPDPRFPMSPPPASPLPPTPPSVRERKARLLSHRKSHSQSSSSVGFSFGPIAGDDVAEIDALSAKVLPLLVPGLKIGADVRVREDWERVSPRDRTVHQTGTMRSSRTVPAEMGGCSSGFSTDFSSPDMHSTPVEDKKVPLRQKKTSTHRRHHFSLPSLSLGKDGIHALSTWRSDLNRALESKIGQFASTPSDHSNRRNTVYGGELVPNSGSHLNVVTEDDELLRPASPAQRQRPVSAQTFGPDTLSLPVEVHDGRASSRNSLATLITALDQELRVPLPPPSSTSEITLFDLENFEAEGPLASSTPHESQRTKPKSKSRAPPVPKMRDGPSATRRSSIKYIISDENAPSSPQIEVPTKTQGFAQWGARAIRPLVPKSPKSKSKKAKMASPPAGGLRPLSLLQERNLNQASNETRPLTLSKKSKVTDENADPDAPARAGKGKASLKPLKLARNETTKERALLRQQEVLPDVVVRPPSGAENGYYGYA
ncbi:hypothetical protein GY45DRAFT_642787 [Cubamyces sp. BRFM 1775]|nr:hypothetical protein GY45DRAFT_642787 [Cubamyces sp. BRFM 1775]